MGLVFLAIINELDLFLLPSDRKFKFYVLIKNITFVINLNANTKNNSQAAAAAGNVQNFRSDAD